MQTTHSISIGQFVKSKAGRDKDKLFVVVNIVDEEYVLISDGDLRKMDGPKKKKMKHLIKYNIMSEEIKDKIEKGQKVNNSLLRRELEKLGYH